MSTSLISARRLNASASTSFEIPILTSASNFSQKLKKASGGTAFGSKPNALCLTYSLVDNPHFEALRSIFFFSFSVTLATILMSLISFHLFSVKGILSDFLSCPTLSDVQCIGGALSIWVIVEFKV